MSYYYKVISKVEHSAGCKSPDLYFCVPFEVREYQSLRCRICKIDYLVGRDELIELTFKEFNNRIYGLYYSINIL